VLVWAGVKWENGDPDTAHYVCQAPHDPATGEVCATAWTEAERLEAIGKGEWFADKPFKGHASFHASQLSSKRVPLHRVVKEFLDAKPYPERLKQWVNTVLAETWEEGGEKVDPDSLFARREAYNAADVLPEKCGLVVAAVDIQDNRWECEIAGWGAHEERWSLDYIVHHADPTSPAYWSSLDDVLQRTFKHPTGATLRSRRLASTPAATIPRPSTSFAATATTGASLRSRASPAPTARSGRRRPRATSPKRPTCSWSASTRQSRSWRSGS
jgi:phage terminase large subunit GpA-like protein